MTALTSAQRTTHDPRLAFLGNGYVRNMHRRPEPAVSLPQAIMSGIAVVAFALGVLAFAVAATC